MPITREDFIGATGREPQDDDLERVNCDKAGQIGHLCCGWDYKANKPNYETFGLRHTHADCHPAEKYEHVGIGVTSDGQFVRFKGRKIIGPA